MAGKPAITRRRLNKQTSPTSANLRDPGGGAYFIGRREEVVGHLLEVGRLAGVDEAHHLFEDVRVHIADVNTVLGREAVDTRLEKNPQRNVPIQNKVGGGEGTSSECTNR